MTASFLDKKLIPVAVIDAVEDAVPLAESLLAGGLNVIEVTLRTDAALKAIENIRKDVPGISVGAGTLLDHTLLARLVDIGVSFAISPGINLRVIEAAQTHMLPLIPGIMTPSEIEQARNFGLDTLKFFPAEAAGGPAMLKALAGPYAHTGIRFIPTGGINPDNLMSYLAIPGVVAVGGSWFVGSNLLKEKKFDEIARLTHEALELIHDKRVTP